MAKEVVMPKQGNSVESCLILEWKVKEGEKVKSGDPLCEVETDKATFAVEADQAGTLLKILFDEGADVPVLTPIAILGEEGEDIRSFLPDSAQPRIKGAPERVVAGPQAGVVSPPQPEGAGNLALQSLKAGALRVSPRARNLAKKSGIDLSTITGSGPGGRILEKDVQKAVAAGMKPAAAPVLARHSAARNGRGKNSARDEQGAFSSAAEAATACAVNSATPGEFPGPVRHIPLKSVRKLIAERMRSSLQSTAQLTLHARADASLLLSYRERLKSSPEESELTAVTINDLVLNVVAKLLPRFPYLNAHFLKDNIAEYQHVHLGLAVDTPRGLMVPVIRNADMLSLREISREAKRLKRVCLEGSVTAEELSGGTFTVTNLGSLGVESFTPLLNPPQVGILGVCAIVPQPVLVKEELKLVPHIGLSLTFDHQAVDGAPAARFLQALTGKIKDYDLFLAG